MSKQYILALDQGTTGSRAFILNKQGNVVAKSYKEGRCNLVCRFATGADGHEHDLVSKYAASMQARLESVRALRSGDKEEFLKVLVKRAKLDESTQPKNGNG